MTKARTQAKRATRVATTVTSTAPAPAQTHIPELLSARDLRKHFGLATSTLYNWRDTQSFPRPLQLGANCVRWRRADIENWIASRQVAETWGGAA